MYLFTLPILYIVNMSATQVKGYFYLPAFPGHSLLRDMQAI